MRRHFSTSAVRVGTPDVASELDWEHVYDVHAPRLRRLIRRKVEAAAIEDVLQETFLRAFKSRHTIDRARPMKPWLNTIALRAIADVQRGAVRTVETLDVDTECDELALACDALGEELLTRAKQLGIKHAFASLNSRHRRLLQLVDIEGMPYEYVARHEQMTTDAVKAALARARSNFRASYVVFTEKSGLFGAGALVGPLAVKLRLRLQRWHDFVTHHAAGVGAATLTVAVVASATIPSTRPDITSAQERIDASLFATAPLDILQIVGSYGSTHAEKPDDAEPSGGSAGTDESQPASVSTEGSVIIMRAEETRGVGVHAASSSDAGATRAYAGLVVDCSAGASGPVLCAVIDAAPPAEPVLPQD